jgi:hypothetical protein
MDSGRKRTYAYMPIHPTATLHLSSTLWDEQEKKDGTGGDVQLTTHKHVAPWPMAVFLATGSARCLAPPAGKTMGSPLASWLTFLREPGAPSLAPASRDACGNGFTFCFRCGQRAAMQFNDFGLALVATLHLHYYYCTR